MQARRVTARRRRGRGFGPAAVRNPGVTGWNIYIGLSDGIAELQNDKPIATGSSWTKPGNALRQGKAVVEGQVPDYMIMERRILPRG